MATTITSITPITPNPFDDKPKDIDAFAASLLTSVFHSLAGTWTHEIHMENATTVDIPAAGHGLCSFTLREASRIQGVDDSAGGVEEMLVHENGEYSIEGSAQSSIYMPSLLWSRNFVWRMDKRGSNPVIVRPQLEKQRRPSSAGRKGSFFRRLSLRNSDSLPLAKEAESRRMSAQSEEGNSGGGGSMWRRMTVPVMRRNSKAGVLLEEQPGLDDRVGGLSNIQQTERSLPSPCDEARVIPQIDIYTTKPQTRKISFHLHSLTFNIQPDLWRQQSSNGEELIIEAQGHHFSGEERYGTKYEFNLRSKPNRRTDEDEATSCYYVERWSAVEVVRGPAGKDKMTTTRYSKTRRAKGSAAAPVLPVLIP